MRFIQLFYALASLIICPCIYGCSESGGRPQKSNTSSVVESGQKPALGVPVPELNMAADVRAYIRDVLAAPLPDGYRLPADILAIADYDAAVGMVGKHFPEFNGLEGEGLLAAVKKHPYKYQEMILEARAIRKHFFPAHQH